MEAGSAKTRAASRLLSGPRRRVGGSGSVGLDPRLSPYDVDVEVKDGVAILSGTVEQLEARLAAEEDAENTVGVWRVRNEIRVRPQVAELGTPN